MPVCESSYSKIEEFFLFSTIIEASMIDKKVSDKSVYFELSIGNAGNSMDGEQCSNVGDDGELETVDTSSFNSTTSSCRPISHDKLYFFQPYWDYKVLLIHFSSVFKKCFHSFCIKSIKNCLFTAVHECAMPFSRFTA